LNSQTKKFTNICALEKGGNPHKPTTFFFTVVFEHYLTASSIPDTIVGELKSITIKHMKYTGENTMPLVKVKNKFQITIPSKVRDEVHIKEGDFLEIEAERETIIIKPKVIVDRNSVAASINEGM